ncbi:unnamed protein product [Protopolystoma xenopodis]|uniref:Uncharacterized protein n=1 Tax=Protopolystoma xenopodis TaxID=117903 RepID=A0A448WN38_9PLAT|nr:unnamed protein product [Protopolystoma xenopodis]
MSFARRQGMLFTEASAKTGEGVDLMFIELAEKIYLHPEFWDDNRFLHNRIRITQSPPSSGCSCSPFSS